MTNESLAIWKEAITRAMYILEERPGQWITLTEFESAWKRFSGELFRARTLGVRGTRDFLDRLQRVGLVLLDESDFPVMRIRRNPAEPLLQLEAPGA